MAIHLPEPSCCSFLEFFPGLMLSLLPLFYLHISSSAFYMFLSRKPLQLTKTARFKNPSSAAQAWVVAVKKDNIMRYMWKFIIKIFGKSILFYAKCFRLTFKYVRVSTMCFNFHCLVSDHKLSKNMYCRVRIYRTKKMFWLWESRKIAKDRGRKHPKIYVFNFVFFLWSFSITFCILHLSPILFFFFFFFCHWQPYY